MEDRATADTHVQGLIRKTKQYEFGDGLRDLQLSLILGLGGLVIWFLFSPWWAGLLSELVRRFGRWAAWAGMLWVLLPALAAWAMLALMGMVRRRWLWAQTGNVTPTMTVVPRRVNLIAAAILIIGIGGGVVLWTRGVVDDVFALRMLWAATGWSFGYTLYGVGRQIGITRYVWIGPLGGLASSLVLFFTISFSQAALALGLGWGVVLAASGVITLRQAWLLAEREANVRPD
jgi:hypothetical protein